MNSAACRISAAATSCGTTHASIKTRKTQLTNKASISSVNIPDPTILLSLNTY
jgi:hypothetical protein